MMKEAKFYQKFGRSKNWPKVSGFFLVFFTCNFQSRKQIAAGIKDDDNIIRQTNLDRQGSRPVPNICHLHDLPSFSLQTTFKGTVFVVSKSQALTLIEVEKFSVGKKPFTIQSSWLKDRGFTLITVELVLFILNMTVRYQHTVTTPHTFIFSFCSYIIQHCFICRPSDSTVPTDAGIEPRTVATGALAVRRSNHQARSHPRPDLIRMARSHPQARSHPSLPAYIERKKICLQLLYEVPVLNPDSLHHFLFSRRKDFFTNFRVLIAGEFYNI